MATSSPATVPEARDPPTDERRQHDDPDGDEHVRESRGRDELVTLRCAGVVTRPAPRPRMKRRTSAPKQRESRAGIVLDRRVHQLPRHEVMLDVEARRLHRCRAGRARIPVSRADDRERQRHQGRRRDLEGVGACQGSRSIRSPGGRSPVGELQQSEAARGRRSRKPASSNATSRTPAPLRIAAPPPAAPKAACPSASCAHPMPSRESERRQRKRPDDDDLFIAAARLCQMNSAAASSGGRHASKEAQGRLVVPRR